MPKQTSKAKSNQGQRASEKEAERLQALKVKRLQAKEAKLLQALEKSKMLLKNMALQELDEVPTMASAKQELSSLMQKAPGSPDASQRKAIHEAYIAVSNVVTAAVREDTPNSTIASLAQRWVAFETAFEHWLPINEL